MSANVREAPIPSSEGGGDQPDRRLLSRRAAWLLLAVCAWTLYVWITRIVIMAGQDESVGFKAVHGVLAVISIAFGLAAGWIGLRRLRVPR